VFGLSPRIVSEALLSALLFVAFLAWRFATGRSIGTSAARLSRPHVAGWMPPAIVAVILITAVGTYMLRGRHERQLNAARRLLDTGNYAGALEMADRADAWPHGNRPGRIDMIRAEAYQRLGHLEAAEALYLRAYEKDPNNFWALADLAESYASSLRPTAERRRLARMRASELQRRFPRHPSLHNVLEGIERELSRVDPTE
jgi:tetratricopeptide (TPR) repeat protein